MKTSAKLSTSMRSDPRELAAMRERIEAWLIPQGWDTTAVTEIVLAVDEALTNVIRHAYHGRTTEPIELRCGAVHDAERGDGVEIVIRDYGRQTALEDICGRDLNELRPGGLGVHIIRSTMDRADYSHAEGGGMTLVMRKYRRSADSSESVPARDP